jgi:hypothetical protein
MTDIFIEGDVGTTAKKKTGLKIFVIVFIVILSSFLVVYTYLAIDSVRSRLKLAKSQTEGDLVVNLDLVNLMKDKAWIESRLKMAENDSIGLAIDLEEKIIQLELKGVVVMKSKIRDYSTSGFFKRMDGNIYFTMFGSPLAILGFESSIAKNPLKVVQAPKTEAEADANFAKKDSIPKENVYWTVKLNRDLELNIQGIDSVADSQSKYKFGQSFEFKRNVKNILRSLHDMILLKKLTYTPEILISIPENDAKAILHALPRQALITIRI